MAKVIVYPNSWRVVKHHLKYPLQNALFYVAQDTFPWWLSHMSSLHFATGVAHEDLWLGLIDVPQCDNVYDTHWYHYLYIDDQLFCYRLTHKLDPSQGASNKLIDVGRLNSHKDANIDIYIYIYIYRYVDNCCILLCVIVISSLKIGWWFPANVFFQGSWNSNVFSPKTQTRPHWKKCVMIRVRWLIWKWLLGFSIQESKSNLPGMWTVWPCSPNDLRNPTVPTWYSLTNSWNPLTHLTLGMQGGRPDCKML